MYHYSPETALEELRDEAQLPNPVHVRDMILRRNLSSEQALHLHRDFQEYQKAFAELMRKAEALLTNLAAVPPKLS
jgi:hypothetical protein